MPFDSSSFDGTILMLLALTGDFNVVVAGTVAALLLRFEVMAHGLVTAVQMVEFAIWGYILYHGCRLIIL